MKPVSTAYEQTGRAAQKGRTRAALVEAARALVAAGRTPTVEDAAAAASISRTTAYRYFPNKRALLVEAHPEAGASSMLPPDAPADPGARLDLVVDAFTQMISRTEAQQRTMLRLSLDEVTPEPGELPLRQGRAIGWIGEALEVLKGRLSDGEIAQLVKAIRATIGIESLVWLVDVAGMSRGDAARLMRWSAAALLESALTTPPPAPS